MTFGEFVKWIIGTYKKNNSATNLDPHWKPMYLLSFPCIIDYDYFGRFETLHEDFYNVLRDGFKVKDFSSLPFMSMIKETNAIKIATYFKNISSTDIDVLRKIYSKDFEFFGYDCDPPMVLSNTTMASS